MALIRVKTSPKDDFHYYTSDRKVTVQIGKSTNKGLYIWTVFHPDIKCAIWGEESKSIEAALDAANAWILQWVVEKSL